MEHFIKQIRENYVIIAFMVMLIMSWTNINTRMVQAEKDIKDIKVTLQEITDIKITIQRIDTSVDFIKREVVQ